MKFSFTLLWIAMNIPRSAMPHSLAKVSVVEVQLKCEGTRWRTGGEVKGKLANGVGSQFPSLLRNLVYPALLPLMHTPRLPIVDWTDAPAVLNGLVRFAESQNLASARVPSHFKRSLPKYREPSRCDDLILYGGT